MDDEEEEEGVVAARMMRQQARQEAELQRFFAAAAGCLLQHKKRRCSRKHRPGQEPGQGVLIDGSMLMVESGSYETILQVTLARLMLVSQCLPICLPPYSIITPLCTHHLSFPSLIPPPSPLPCHVGIARVRLPHQRGLILPLLGGFRR